MPAAWPSANSDDALSGACPSSPPARPLPPYTAVIDGLRLRELRRQAGLSIENLAWQAKVGQTTLGRLERQSRPRCRARTLVRLARALGQDPAAIAVLIRVGKNHPATVPQPGGPEILALPRRSHGIAASRDRARRPDRRER